MSRSAPLPSLSEATFLRIITNEDSDAAARFLASFPRRLKPIAREGKRAFDAVAKMGSRLADVERSHTVYLFMHAAMNTVVSSTHLLVIGYPLVSGHLMRQFGEATTMALLCTDSESGVLEEFDSLQDKYPVHRCFSKLDGKVAARLSKLIGFNPNKWSTFVQLTRFYNRFSHSSAFSRAFHVRIDEPGVIVVGPDFDPGKRRQLSIELRRRRSALKTIVRLANALGKALPQRARRRRDRSAT